MEMTMEDKKAVTGQLLNVDARNKTGPSIISPYEGALRPPQQYRSPAQRDRGKRLKRRGKKSTGN
jgi:hypothetical protein